MPLSVKALPVGIFLLYNHIVYGNCEPFTTQPTKLGSLLHDRGRS